MDASATYLHSKEERRTKTFRVADGSFILPSLQAAFGITLSPWIGSAGPTVILLYHILLVLAKVPSFPMALNRLAKLCDDLRCQHNPPRALDACSHTLQPPCVAPISNRRNVHIQQFRRCQGGVAPIASLPAGTESRPFGAVQWNVVGSPNPVDFARGEGPSQPRMQSLFIEEQGDLCGGLRGRQFTHARNHLSIGAACISYYLGAGNRHVRERFRSPADTDLDDPLPLGERHIF